MRIKQPFSPRLISFLFAGLLLYSAFCFQLAVPRSVHAASSSSASVVLVHGINGGDGWSGSAINGSMSGDCMGYWRDVKSFLSSNWGGDVRAVQYYKNEGYCNSNDNEQNNPDDLHNPAYASNCTDYHAGNEGSNNESLYHISCLFAWYLYDNFGQQNQDVVLVGHSMGGLIIRETMYQVQNSANQGSGDPFPSTIGHVLDAVTLDTPHGGIHIGGSLFGCGGCTQLGEISEFSSLMIELRQNAQNPQTPGGTVWTLIGSTCDPFVPVDRAIDMQGANHVIIYNDTFNHNGCYDHSAGLHDANPAGDASAYHCDMPENNIQNGTYCSVDYSGPSFSSTSSFSRELSELVTAIFSAS
jgi:PGAP1-like protein